MPRIKDLPIEYRPREKAYRYGIEELTDVELLAIVIGNGSKGNSALEIAYQIMKDKITLSNLLFTDFQTLTKYYGINKNTAIKLGAVFEMFKRFNKRNDTREHVETLEDLIDRISGHFVNQATEKVLVVALDRKKRIVLEKCIHSLSESGIQLSSKNIFKEVIKSGSNSFYIIHNHVDDDCKPSREDLLFYEHLANSSKKLGLHLIDSLIYTTTKVYSMRAKKDFDI